MDKWKKVGTFTKRQLSGKKVVEKLHAIIKELAPSVKHISDVAITRETDDYLSDRLDKVYGKKAGPWISLQYSPAIVESGEPFTLYRRVKSRKEK